MMKNQMKKFAVMMLAACAAMGTAASADQLEDIKSAGKLTVGIEGTFAPFTYHDESGELAGYDVEVAQNLAEKLGVEVAFVEADWDSLLAAEDSGRVDLVINDVGITEERQEKYDFTDPYFYVCRQVSVAADNEEIKGVEDLDGKKVATTITNSFAEEIQAMGATIVPISTSEEAASLVTSGRADFCLFNPVVLNAYLEQHPQADIKVAFIIPGADELIGIPVRKGETALLDALNTALDEMREDGTLAALSEKYFNGDYTRPSDEAAEAATEAE